MYTNLNKSIYINIKIILKILMITIYWFRPCPAEQDIFDFEETTKYDVRCKWISHIVMTFLAFFKNF